MSAYGWANGDIKDGVSMLPDADAVASDAFSEYLLGEVVETSAGWMELEPESPEHWQEAISRCAQLKREIDAVYAALERFAPEEN